MSHPGTGVAETLAGFVEAVSIDELGAGARARVAEHVMDALGTGLAATAELAGKLVAEVVGASDDGPVRLLGSGHRLSPVEGAWANGTLCHLLDFDDSTLVGHPTAAILPAALAVGELLDADGADLVLAVAIGYEVFERLSQTCRASELVARHKGLHLSPVWGAPAAAMAAGKLLRLDAQELVVGMGLAASSVLGGLTEQFGTWAKGIDAGNAARAGVLGALLASRGYVGSPAAIDGRYGLLVVIGAGEQLDLTEFGRELGTSWSIESDDFGIKLVPACYSAQRMIELALDLRERELARPGDIERIEVLVSGALVDLLHVDRPTRGFGGRFSLRFCIAAALLDGTITIDTFSDDRLERSDMQALMDKVELVRRDDAAVGTQDDGRIGLRVHRHDGPVVIGEAGGPARGEGSRISHEVIVRKYTSCALRALPQAKVEASIRLLHELESTSVHQLMDAVTVEED